MEEWSSVEINFFLPVELVSVPLESRLQIVFLGHHHSYSFFLAVRKDIIFVDTFLKGVAK